MGQPIDLTGRTFGYWTVLSRSGINKHKKVMWNCLCECGTAREVVSGNLTNGLTTSCGCKKFERATSKWPEYRAWQKAKDRCYNPKSQGFPDYGARGIRMCDEWRESFEAFFRDIGNRPTANHSLERWEVNGNYEPNNCMWATPTQQMRNTRRVVASMEIAREIRRLRAEGLTYPAISAQVGLQVGTVTSIAQGKVWKEQA